MFDSRINRLKRSISIEDQENCDTFSPFLFGRDMGHLKHDDVDTFGKHFRIPWKPAAFAFSRVGTCVVCSVSTSSRSHSLKISAITMSLSWQLCLFKKCMIVKWIFKIQSMKPYLEVLRSSSNFFDCRFFCIL